MIPPNVVAPLMLTVVVALLAILLWGVRFMHQQFMALHWDSMLTGQMKRARRVQYQLDILRTIVLLTAAVTGAITVIAALISMMEVPRG